MSRDSLLRQIDPYRFAENGADFCGSLSIKNMARLCPSLFTDEGEVEVSVSFGIDQQGVKFVKGHFATQVILQCQRCLESFSYHMAGDFNAGMVNTEEAANKLPGNYDPLIIKEDVLIIQDIIEDELILSLPLVPMHNLESCKVKLPVIVADNAEITKKANPFRVIETLKKKDSE